MKDGQDTRQFDGVKVKKDLAQTMKEMTQVEVGINKKDPRVPRRSNGQFNGVKMKRSLAGIIKHGQVTRQFHSSKVKKELAQAMKEMTQVEVVISKKDIRVPRKSNGQVPRHFNGVQLSGAGAGQDMKNNNAKFLGRESGKTTDPDPQLQKDETLRHSPNIQRRHAAQRNLRGEIHGSRQMTKQQAIRVIHGRKNGTIILAEAPRGTLVENRQKPKLLDAHQIGQMTEGRQDETIGKQSSGAVMLEQYTTTNGRETDGSLHPIGPSTFRGEITQGAKPMRVMTVGSIRRKFTASMFATDAVSRKLAKENR